MTADPFDRVLGARRGPGGPGGPGGQPSARSAPHVEADDERWWRWHPAYHQPLSGWLATRVAEGCDRLVLSATAWVWQSSLDVLGPGVSHDCELGSAEALWLLDHWPAVLRYSPEDDFDRIEGWLTYAAARANAHRTLP